VKHEQGTQIESNSETIGSRSRGRAHRYRGVADILDMSERQVIREVRAGRLKVDYIGPKMPRVFDDSLDEYVKRSQGGA
jgi:hypothetical protein